MTADALTSLPNGTVWSINQTANTISEVTFPDLVVKTFDVPTPNAGLAGITGGPDGNVWFTESIAKQIGRITADGLITEFPTPAGSPSPQWIFPALNGTLWATACPFPGNSCYTFIVQSTDGTSSLLPIQAPTPFRYSADRCTPGSDGNVWCFGHEETFNPFSSHLKIGRVGPTGGVTAFALPTATQASAIGTAPDGNVWCAWNVPETETGLARIMPSGVITEYAIMTGNRQSWIFGLAVGSEGNFYCADRQTSILYQFVLSTATDAGTATINWGSIGIDIPEDIVVGGLTSFDPCALRSLILRSGGSSLGSLVVVSALSPMECTDLIAEVEIDRYSSGLLSEGTAICYDNFNSHDDAKGVVLSIHLPAGSQVSTEISAGFFFANGTCKVTGLDIRCDAPIVKKNFEFAVDFLGAIGPGNTSVRCSSVTAESNSGDNTDLAFNVLGLPSNPEPPAEIDLRLGTRYSFSKKPAPR